jgi:hypothetical protein
MEDKISSKLLPNFGVCLIKKLHSVEYHLNIHHCESVRSQYYPVKIKAIPVQAVKAHRFVRVRGSHIF